VVAESNGGIEIYFLSTLVAMVTNVGTQIAITRLTKERIGILTLHRGVSRSGY